MQDLIDLNTKHLFC